MALNPFEVYLKIKVRCQKCKKHFLTSILKRNGKYFCSVYCAHSHDHPGPKPDLSWKQGKVCIVCLQVFIPDTKKQSICSKECRREYRLLHAEPRDLEFVKKRIKVDRKTGCWIWQKSLAKGYGQIGVWVGNKTVVKRVHRFVYELVFGPIPEGLLVRHKPGCVSPACCNPNHLLVGTSFDNYHDSEEAYKRASSRKKGITTAIAIPVKINGKTYPSIQKAGKRLGISWKKAKSLSVKI